MTGSTKRWAIFVLLVSCTIFPIPHAFALPSNPIVFVTQPPWPYDFTTINATFGNHLGSMDAVPRGGDLYIRYVDGTLKNLTAAAGYGNANQQGASSIAVRDPTVHWSGNKVIFSMLIGAPTQQYQVNSYRWQMYEVTGLGVSDTPVITKVVNQPDTFNNVSPIYATDDSIIFTSDRSRDGAAHLYPQRDEYESSPTNTGLWKLTPGTGMLVHLDHAPSGDFSPSIDSFGRVIFTRWDHLQRDQQNRCSNSGFQAFNYSSEASDAQVLDTDVEVFPEARGSCEQDPDDHLDLHRFNHFLPWQINEDGTEMETINHVGRHELVDYLGKSFDNDSNVVEFYGQYSRLNQNAVENMFQILEDPSTPGRYVALSAPEFGTHASGQIIRFNAPPTLAADAIEIEYVTHADTAGTDDTPSVNHIGLSRDPLPLSDGSIVASHTSETRADSNTGSTAAPQSRYSYRIKEFSPSGGYHVPGALLTSGIQKTLSFWSPDVLVSFNAVTMWELQPRELVARTRPNVRSSSVPAIEQNVFDDVGVSVIEFQDYLRENQLALVVSRNVTTRDKLDRQQPANLRVKDTETQSLPRSGKIYDISHFQFFQGDQLRGYAGGSGTAGRRIIPTEMHGVDDNPENAQGPAGSVKVANDGSVAAFVPATRPLTYQLTDEDGVGVVRERLWLTFQPGEIRVCASCHGVNSQDHLGNGEPTNEPEALRYLLEEWKSLPHESLQFTLSGKRKVRGGKRVTVSVSGNERAANKSISVAVKVRRKDCGVIKSVTTSSDSEAAVALRIPAIDRPVALKLRLLYAGETRAKRSLKVAPGVTSKALTDQRICRALKRGAR